MTALTDRIMKYGAEVLTPDDPAEETESTVRHAMRVAEIAVAEPLTEATPAIAHLSGECCPPFTRTLCGRPIVSGAEPQEVLPDCVVCATLVEARRYCPNCGSLCHSVR
jgi:hypothetical protein